MTSRVNMLNHISALPPYSPGHNPPEQVWDELREKFLANRLFKSLGTAVGAAMDGLRRIEVSPCSVARPTEVLDVENKHEML
jgi:transposase